MIWLFVAALGVPGEIEVNVVGVIWLIVKVVVDFLKLPEPVAAA